MMDFSFYWGLMELCLFLFRQGQASEWWISSSQRWMAWKRVNRFSSWQPLTGRVRQSIQKHTVYIHPGQGITKRVHKLKKALESFYVSYRENIVLPGFHEFLFCFVFCVAAQKVPLLAENTCNIHFSFFGVTCTFDHRNRNLNLYPMVSLKLIGNSNETLFFVSEGWR